MEIKEILLFGLAEQTYSRVEFWQIHHRESGFSEKVFWMKLNDCWGYYSSKIESKITELNSWGNSVSDFEIALLGETNQQMIGHIGRYQLAILKASLIDLAIAWNLLVYYYEYDQSNIQISEFGSPAKQYQIFKSLNEQRFENELKDKIPEDISGFLNFHLAWFKRKGGKESDWIVHNRKKIPSSFTIHQKDAFFTWFEKIDGEDLKEILPNSLKDIFVNEKAYIECMDALRNVKNPILSSDNMYLLGKRMKGSFAAWFEIIKTRGKIKIVSNATMAQLLNKEIHGLNLFRDGGTLGDVQTTHYKKYYTPLSKLIQ